MSSNPAPNLRNDAAVRNYTLIAAAALLVLALVQVGERSSVFGLLPVLAGFLGLALRSGLGVLMLLFTLAGQIFIQRQSGFPWGPGWGGGPSAMQFQPLDVILCGAVLAYAISLYRLIGLVKNLLPAEPAFRDRRRGWLGGVSFEARHRRSTRLVGPVEWALLLLALPLWAILSQLLWMLRPAPWLQSGLPPALTEWTVLIVPAWVAGMILLVISGLLGYLGRRGMTVEEGRLLLQDTVWHDTRREQRRINRWLAADRLRREREENKS
jgi:hypothetical protein